MKIAVISASGRSGLAFVTEALNAGHYVNAGVHRYNNLMPHPNLNVLQGDATNPEFLKKLFMNQDAIVSLIGHTRKSPKNVQQLAIKAAISTMSEMGISRIVSLTGTGVRFPGDKISLIDRILNTSIKFIDPARIEDGVKHISLLKISDTNWTIVRVLKLQNGKSSDFRLSLNGPAKVLVSRQAVAKAILQVLTNNSYVKQSPIISK